MSYSRLVIVAAGVLLAAQSASAQVIGTFRWNTAPYCNVMTLTVTQVGAVYRLEGYEDQCGGNPRNTVIGIGVQQPTNGSITLGLNIVPAVGTSRPVALRATISSTFSGSWADSINAGTFVFSPGAVSGGPRTTPVNYDTLEGSTSAPGASGDEVAALRVEVEALKAALASLLARKDDE